MRAAAIDGYGGSERLAVRELPDPQPPAPGQVLVRVRAASVNPIDWKLRKGSLRLVMPVRFPFVPGHDLAGEVAAVGPEVTRFEPGDLVFGAVDPRRDGGACAELALVRESALAAKPGHLSFEEAAALPLAGLTALQALRDKGELTAGESVLVNGGAGGVGHFAVQIARAFGARVTAVAGAGNQALLRELGAHRTLDYEEEDFTGLDETWDIVFDAVGLGSFRDVTYVLSPEGGIYVTTRVRPDLAAWTLFTTLGGLVGYRKRARSILVKHSADDLEVLAHLSAQGKLRVVLDEVFSLEEIGKAHDASERGHARGKIVVRV